MRYVKYFDINGVKSKQVACIEVHGRPNAATEGAVGVLAIDVDSPNGEMYRCVAVNGGIYTWEHFLSATDGVILGMQNDIADLMGKTHIGYTAERIEHDFTGDSYTLVNRRTATVLVLQAENTVYEQYRLNRVGVMASPGATVRFVVWKPIEVGDGTYKFRQVGVLGEAKADSGTGIATLTIKNGYVLEDVDIRYCIVAQCSDASILCSANPYAGLTFTSIPCFEDGDYTNSEDGFELAYTIGQPDHALFNVLYDISCRSGQSIDDFAADTDNRLTKLENETPGGSGSTPPTSIDLSTLDTDGKIKETYADGTTKTTTMEFDADGNPVKITDGDGNETVLTW
jgi:hypothetical protein